MSTPAVTTAAETAATPLRIAIAGPSGRMGRMLIEAVLDAPDCELSGALAHAGSAHIGQDAAAFLGRTSGVAISADLGAVLAASQVLIDFTRPAATLVHVAACADTGVALVIGTTGFGDAEKATIRAAAARTAIFMAPNMSVGVNVVMRLLEQAAHALSQGYDIEISHKSSSRATYAQGSLRAARHIALRGPGLYDMNHVLGSN